MDATLGTVIAETAGRIVIGIGGMAVRREGAIATHALGSCVGVTMYDATARVGAMLHAQLPELAAHAAPARAADHGRYVDLGLSAMLGAVLAEGAVRQRLRVTLCGGANPTGGNDLFAIGKRNLVAARRFFWQQQLPIAGEDCGGTAPRNLELALATGAVRVTCEGRGYAL